MEGGEDCIDFSHYIQRRENLEVYFSYMISFQKFKTETTNW
jgi:hypothetical protein